ncbi:hypothetical protein LXL04_012680 [Taraxacum kok-saghyz]
MNTANPIGRGANTFHPNIYVKLEKTIENLEPITSFDNRASTYRDMGIACISLGVSGGEDGVYKNKCSDDFGTQSCSFTISIGELVGATAIITRDAGGAVNEDEDHATKGPRDTENSYAAALVVAVEGIGLGLVADDSQHGDVKEQEGGDEFRNDGSVERPFRKFLGVKEGSRRRVFVIFCGVFMTTTNLNVFAHVSFQNSV